MRSKRSKRYNKEMMDAMQKLYGEARGEEKTEPKPSVADISKKKAKRNDCPLEADEQIRLVVWLRKRNILFYAIPMGGSRHKREAMNLKRQGSTPGVPDLCLPIASHDGKYPGLYIELKRQKGSYASDEQKWWLAQLQQNGYYACIARGCDAAIKIITEYLGLKDEK